MGDIGVIKKRGVEPKPVEVPSWDPLAVPEPVTPERELVPVRVGPKRGGYF